MPLTLVANRRYLKPYLLCSFKSSQPKILSPVRNIRASQSASLLTKTPVFISPFGHLGLPKSVMGSFQTFNDPRSLDPNLTPPEPSHQPPVKLFEQNDIDLEAQYASLTPTDDIRPGEPRRAFRGGEGSRFCQGVMVVAVTFGVCAGIAYGVHHATKGGSDGIPSSGV